MGEIKISILQLTGAERIIHSLPLDTVLLLISELLPKAQNIQSTTNKSNVTAAILDYLRSVSLQEVLPPRQLPLPRKFLVCIFFQPSTSQG